MSAREETLKHIHRVRVLLDIVISEFRMRAQEHDKSKLESPEAEVFEEYTTKLKGTTYGSPEYMQFLKEMAPALTHHYQYNSHHPEFYEDGIKGMNLFDLLEMLVDWKAATERHDDGSLERSIEQNQKRFDYSDETKGFLRNTAKAMGFI
jgi:hypothetical protein